MVLNFNVPLLKMVRGKNVKFWLRQNKIKTDKSLYHLIFSLLSCDLTRFLEKLRSNFATLTRFLSISLPFSVSISISHCVHLIYQSLNSISHNLSLESSLGTYVLIQSLLLCFLESKTILIWGFDYWVV